MITFIVTPEHKYTLAYLKRSEFGNRIDIITYPELLQKRRLKAGTYIFSDIERLDHWELRFASDVYRILSNAGHGFLALNNPAKVKTRYGLLRMLHRKSLNDFDVYRLDEAVSPTRFPVFLRREFDHGIPLSGLIENQNDLDRHIEELIESGHPTSGILLVEYCAEPVARNTYRRYASFRVANKIMAHNCVHENNWLVKYGSAEAATEEMQVEAAEFVESNRYETEINKAFQIANIDYGRADFGICGGRVQVYEINTNPYISYDNIGNSEIRRKSMALSKKRLFEVLTAIDRGAPFAMKVKLQSEYIDKIRDHSSMSLVRTYRD